MRANNISSWVEKNKKMSYANEWIFRTRINDWIKIVQSICHDVLCLFHVHRNFTFCAIFDWQISSFCFLIQKHANSSTEKTEANFPLAILQTSPFFVHPLSGDILFIAILHHWWHFVIRVADWTNDIFHSEISSFMLLISSLRISTKLYLRHLFGLHLLC